MKLHIYFLILFSIFSFIVPMTVMATEEPKYELIEKSGKLELRQYQPMLIAEVLVDGNMDQASGIGFRLIADYIFGNNITKAGNSQKIKMTAPVTIEPRSEEISMTIPISLKKNSGRWQVSFVMPRKYTLDTIPLPNNKQIMLRKIPARKVAILEFSGFVNEKNTASRAQELLKWMDKKNLISTGSIELSRYDPPWTLPFLRRNEISVGYAKNKAKEF